MEVLDYKTKALTSKHLAYFKEFKVRSETLKKYNVKAISHFKFKEELKEVKAGLGFIYQGPNESQFEAYFPSPPNEQKFIRNKLKKEFIFGSNLAKEYKFLFITAGKKDCLCLLSQGINAICFNSEATNPTQDQINKITKASKNILICYDNDKTGRKRAEVISKSIPQSTVKHLPKEYNDIAEFFKENTLADWKEKVILKQLDIFAPKEEKEIKADKEVFTIFHLIESYLTKHHKIRFNEISLAIEGKDLQGKWKPINEDQLYIEMNKNGVNTSINKVISVLKSDFVKKYNPLKEYFKSLDVNDTKDYISFLSDKITVVGDQLDFKKQFKKWLVRCVATVFNEGYFNKQALIFIQKGHNTGKTSLCRWLCPPILSEYIAEDITDDKDSRILLCKNFLINLDELAGLNRKEVNSLKSLFSKAQINERLPYDRKNSILPRIASFVGSTNESQFLNDDTGSVRWLCFKLIKLDWSYKKEIDINKVWSQAFRLYLSNDFKEQMDAEDIEKNEVRNSEFQNSTLEYELISTYFKQDDGGMFVTASDIAVKLSELNKRVNKVLIGKALSALGYTRLKHNKKQVYGYFVQQIKEFN